MSYVEDVGQPAKRKILDLVKKYQKSGVIIMSGDVHWSQIFHMGCESYTGYDVPEVCSSGLTHVLDENTYPGIDILMEGHTPLIFKESEIKMQHNFATIDIKRRRLEKGKPSKVIDVTANVRTFNNEPLFTRHFTVG